MKVVEIRKKKDKQLLELLTELREKVQELRFKVAGQEVKNHQELRQTKKTIARILTILNERENERDSK